MRGVKRVALVVAVLLVAFVVLAFVLENQQSVSLSLLGQTSGQFPVSVFVVLALIVGMLIGPLLGMMMRSRRRKPIQSAQS
ncbi:MULTISPECIES: LapA family protein [Pseudomonas]|uniref:LapA family protein n=1 Tax=Pseudomonas TaxID=286 RepID=UPI0020A1C303|nr:MULTISPECIES: LapA family protein [Pseudomonas]MCP1515287.1 putative integral membrane protein [Pseudomonas rhodesiae]MDF9769022.1 putative integral membrane protein [Pseudomonas rhodesiae]